METVLILDGQTNQALACARSLGRAGYRVLTASHVRWPLAGWSRFTRASFHLRGETVEDYARLRQKAREAGTNWILPMTERACILCNAERSEWEKAGVGVACAETATLDLAFDKWATTQRAIKCGVRVPETCLPTSRESADDCGAAVGFPCVVKPRFSNAWDGSRFLPDRSCSYVRERGDLAHQAEGRRQGEDWPLLQSYVEGKGKGVFALCDRGRVVAWFAHERIRDIRPTGSGSSLRRSVPMEARLHEPAARLLAELQWHGPAMVEFRDDGAGEPWLMEVNGRFWTSLELAIQAGVDFPRLWLDILRGRPVTPVENYRTGVTLRWLWGDVRRLAYVLMGRPKGYTGHFPSRSEGLREIFGSQPTGTRVEIYQRDDPWPAVAEWFQGARELFTAVRRASAN